MDLPALEVSPGESVVQVAQRLEESCRGLGIQLAGFETLNTSLSISRCANFFQAWLDGIETVIVVMTEEWSSPILVKILDILLEIRADPDPPGAQLEFRFYSAYPLPAILKTMFGKYRISAMECRAARAAGWGINLRADSCPRLAAVGTQLLADVGIRTSFDDIEGIRRLGRFILTEIHDLKFPADGSPLNTLICLGCLYGEILRSRLPFRSEWAMVKEYQPWPCLVIRPGAGERPAPPETPQSAPKAGGGQPASTRNLGFSPIAMVILLSQEGGEDILEKGAAVLADRCRKEFGLP